MHKSHLLYIGLNGYAGSGKDTVAKMLKIILNNYDLDKKSLYENWKQYNTQHKYATSEDNIFGNVYTIAFADQLKNIASNIFGIDVKRFYDNKSNAWININGNFEYTEKEPWKDYIITAEDFGSSIEFYQHSSDKYWMSLREILVYIGTYLLQREINKNVFVNIIENKITKESKLNDLKYVICTDVRFEQEAEYIRNKRGILINIVRNDIQQLNNIAEHDLDDENDYDIILENDGTYEDLWDKVWNMVHDNDIFKNEIIQLNSHDYSNNFLRLVDESEGIYRVCPEYDMMRVSHAEDNSLAMIDPSGGPCLIVGNKLDNTDYIIEKIFTKTEPFGFYIVLK